MYATDYVFGSNIYLMLFTMSFSFKQNYLPKRKVVTQIGF